MLLLGPLFAFFPIHYQFVVYWPACLAHGVNFIVTSCTKIFVSSVLSFRGAGRFYRLSHTIIFAYYTIWRVFLITCTLISLTIAQQKLCVPTILPSDKLIHPDFCDIIPLPKCVSLVDTYFFAFIICMLGVFLSVHAIQCYALAHIHFSHSHLLFIRSFTFMCGNSRFQK